MIQNPKEEFIKKLVDALNRESKKTRSGLDVCLMVSSVDMNIENCKELWSDIIDYEVEFENYEEDKTGGYTFGSIDLMILKNEGDYENYSDRHFKHYYNIRFRELFNGVDYDPNCCIEKRIRLGEYTWYATDTEFNEYRKTFNNNEEYHNDKNIEKKKTVKKNRIQNMINQLQKEFDELNR